MTPLTLIRTSAMAVAAMALLVPGAWAQQPVTGEQPLATFRSSVDMVRVSAVVRDRKGRFVRDMTVRDFEVLDGGMTRRITEFRNDQSAVSVALLFDVSGSMESRLAHARETAEQILSGLTLQGDEAAVFTFDTRLEEVTPFTEGLRQLPAAMQSLSPFGATSLHDAVARTAEKAATRPALRRAVIVLTDGLDNASRLTAAEVSGMASAIDVPVYIVGIVPAIDNPSADIAATTSERSALTGSLSDLALWTGGRAFVASTIAERSRTARQIVDELRQQYLIAFESSGSPGWHPLVVRAKDKDLTVRARSGYFAGQTRPASN
ncbi:MAG: VWA domain-containing protein [Acidobacteria bacterium]|nr:VWA domain-containing protein [Acidobacteriota bacterium]